MSDSMGTIEETLPKILTVVRQSVGLAAQDVKFHKSLDKSLAKDLHERSDKLLGMISDLTNNIDRNSDEGVDITKDLLENSWKDVGNILDGLFERADIAFDTHNKSSSQRHADSFTYLEDASTARTDDRKSFKRIEKPQLNFKVAIDNSESHPFAPKITSKPNAIESFEESMKLAEETEDEPSHHRHPYMKEIDSQEYPEKILQKAEPIASKDWAKTQATWVDTPEALKKMIEVLKRSTEIAVDLEHHDYRTYYGIVCLMQISDRDQDWIVDTLALRDDLEPLNVIFTNPQIVKVFHGAFMDIIWLQRDLGLYVVNLFDTYHASRLLGFPKHSLAYLLERYAQFKTSKKYQLADWRIRPLPDPMMSYARSDTHFLLNIFDHLRNRLIEEDKLKEVLFESRKVAKRRFEYTKFRPNVPNNTVVSPLNDKNEPWRQLMYQYNLPESKRNVLADLYIWRDKIARESDESVRFVMPNQLLVSLVADAPTDAHGVLATGNFITDSVRAHVKEIASVIKSAIRKSDDEDLALMSTAHDAYEDGLQNTISIGQISNLHSNFDVLIKKIEVLNKNQDEVVNRANRFISDLQNKDSETFSIEYSRDEVISRDADISSERSKLIQTEFAQYQDDLISLPTEVQPTTTPAAAPETVETKSSEQAQDAPLKAKEDVNEVITLRKKNFKNKSAKAPEASPNAFEEAFDYSSAKKVLEDPSVKDKNKNKKNAKKRSFDPYSQDSEGPRAPKKVSRINTGKSSTFRGKRS